MKTNNSIRAPMDNLTVILRRTFNQSDFNGGYIKHWRVIGPKTHKNYESDLSLDGLKTWGIIQ
jgi:hypothetical protein